MTDRPPADTEGVAEAGGAGAGRAAPADAWGVVPAYEDAFGNWTEVPAGVRDALVEAMGGDPDAPGPPDTDAVHVTGHGCPLPVPGPVEVRLETGETVRIEGPVPHDLPHGYHDLLVPGEDEPRRLVLAPYACWLPDDLRTWGWAAQLYSVRSRGSWGIGDLADLRRLGQWSRGLGAGTLLVNPLHAVNPTTPRETSPYFPSTRRWRDPVYLRIEELAGAEQLAERLGPLARHARGDGERIDRDRVYDAKMRALEALWDLDGSGREPGFATFRARHGASLDRFGTFLALAEALGTGWRDWPHRYRHPGNEEVARFAEEHRDRVAFHGWVQWLLDEQLRRAGEAVPLLADLPIGSDPDGADAWEWQDLMADGVTVGAPPDELGPRGQDWSLPAFVPWKLAAARYEPFIQVLRAAFRHAGGLRIDHVLGLFRMFWIPPGGSPAEGTYVRQATGDLLGILALESHRAGAFVVGEDLGTVEAGVRPELAARRILRYQVWWFEEQPVAHWDRDALASISTHDLPTVAGVWSCADVDEQRALGLDPDEERFRELRQRIVDRTGVPPDADATDAVVAVHRALAGAPNRVVVAQLEDAVAERRRVNVPGTDQDDRDNWSAYLPVTLEELEEHPTAHAVAEAMNTPRP